LANQPHDPQQSFQQRWQQEMLRREAEQLQRQMEQLARNNPQASSESNPASSNQSNSRQSSTSQSSADDQSSSQQSSRRARGQSSDSQGQSTDQRIQEALGSMQQATDIMRRNDASQQNLASTRDAADRLRDAANLLAGSQQQMASGKLDSLAREASRLAQQEREQAERIKKLASQQGNSDSNNLTSSDSPDTDLQGIMARMHERDQLALERQQLSDSLSKLQGGVRNAAREMAPNQPDAAQKLRDALNQMDESDLDNHVQRTADWLRRGIDPNSNGTENEIAQGLAKLSQQLQQAQSAISQAKSGQRNTNRRVESAALDQLERLRSQLHDFASSQNGSNGSQQGQRSDGKGSQRGGQQSTSNGQSSWATSQSPLSRSGNRGDNSGALGPDPANRMNGAVSSDTRYGGGRADGTVWGNFDTGNNTPHNRGQQQAVQNDASGNPADTERFFDQHLRELNQLRQMVHDDPQASKDVAALTRQMQRLDPSRFTGNPAMVEQMHREILDSLDKLELQLQRDGASTDARTGKPDVIPTGYQDSVAEYYRRLSKNP